MTSIAEMLGVHDTSIFQLLASFNTLKAVLIENKITTEKEIAEISKREMKKIQLEITKFIDSVEKSLEEDK